MPAALTEALGTRFRAMGTDVHIAIVGGGPSLLASAEARVRDLEAKWSRFRDSSEISELNRAGGRPIAVSPDTFELVRRAVHAWRATGGAFDPTVGAALVAHGYDRDFAAVRDDEQEVVEERVAPVPGPAGIELVAGLYLVVLPAGVSFDAGGIGKGLAADLTASQLLAEGAAGALVNIGGDLRAAGRPPSDEGWVVSVDDPLDPSRELLRLAMPGGGLATSSRVLRQWRTTVGPAHHLIDPATGRPMLTPVVGATVVAGDAWWAEALTKPLFLGGPAALADIGDAHAVVVTADGARHATALLEAALR